MTMMIAWVKRFVGFNPLLWGLSIPLMRQRVREFSATTAPGSGEPDCLVVITPWLGTSVPWFSLAVGLMLSAEGARVTFVIDDQRFGPNAARHKAILYAIDHVMKLVAQRHAVWHLSELTPVEEDATATFQIERLARLNATWALRGEMLERGRAKFEKNSGDQIRAAYRRIATVFRDHRFDMMLVPGGVYGSSGIWARQARASGVRVASYDTGGYETVMLAADGLACQLQDVPRAFASIRARSKTLPKERADILAVADREIARRRAGSDTFQSQIKGAGGGSDLMDGGVLIALNSSWDAAALGPHTVFSGNTEWIVETVRHLLDCTEAPVIVRQHPAERLPFARTSDDYRDLLERHFRGNTRLHFIAAEDPVNSYALLERVSAVVVHTSTIGIEAAAFGRPVITGSNSYYSQLGFVEYAAALSQYRALLEAAATGRLHVTEEMREDARLCFYITQCCNWVFSTFNPADFAKWSRQALNHWRVQPAVQRMLCALLTNTPVAQLNHSALQRAV